MENTAKLVPDPLNEPSDDRKPAAVLGIWQGLVLWKSDSTEPG